MTYRHPSRPLPRLWLMTDERQGDSLWAALDNLPRGAGVIVRHYSLPDAERRVLFKKVVRRARRRLRVLLAGRSAAAMRADGMHGAGPRSTRPMLRTLAAHSRSEIVAAERARADLVFVSPVFPTRSHPGARTLGRVRFGLMIRGNRVPVIALGGITPERAHSLNGFDIYGWAAIDAWTPR